MGLGSHAKAHIGRFYHRRDQHFQKAMAESKGTPDLSICGQQPALRPQTAAPSFASRKRPSRATSDFRQNQRRRKVPGLSRCERWIDFVLTRG